jgi:hypothetical protein
MWTNPIFIYVVGAVIGLVLAGIYDPEFRKDPPGFVMAVFWPLTLVLIALYWVVIIPFSLGRTIHSFTRTKK